MPVDTALSADTSLIHRAKKVRASALAEALRVTVSPLFTRVILFSALGGT